MAAFFLLSHTGTKPCLEAAPDVVQNTNVLTHDNRNNTLGINPDVLDELQLR